MLQRRFWRNFDWILFGAAIVLVVLGLIVIYSTSFKAVGSEGIGETAKQGVFAVAGLVGLLVVARFDYRTLSKLWVWLYGATLLMILFVELFGTPVLGAKRWIDFGFFQFQPSELMKLALIVALAKFYADNYDSLERPKFLLISMGLLALPAVLVFREPDLGSTLVMVAIWIGMTLVSRIRKVYLVGLVAAAAACAPIGYSLLKPFQKARLATFLDPTADALGTGFNVNQSIITVGSGQMFGRGLAAGTQTQLNFLPSLAQHTDFVFASLSEKLGFVGSGLLILVFGVLLVRGLVIAGQAQDRFGMFVAVGVVSMLTFHFFVNVGMNVGIAPVTGIPLPLVSYGGTSLIVMMMAVGLLESVAVRRKKLEFEG